MSQKFQASVHHRDEVSYVKLAGVIDEDNELTALTDKIPSGTAVIDLGEIERINSCGVRDWVNWLGKLEVQSTRAVLVECSPAIVAQINLVNNFTGSGVVKSFYVPYFCPDCDEEKVLLVDATDMGPPPHEPPTCRCDECDLVMDFDDMADSYFAFLSNQKKIAEPEKVNGVIKEFSAAEASDKSKVRSRGSSTSLSGASISSLPSVPSLPSISRPSSSQPQVAAKTGSRPSIAPVTATQPGMRAVGSFQGTAPGSRPGSSPVFSVPGTNPGTPMPAFGAGIVGDRPALAQPRSSAIIYVLVGVLIVAIGVLAFLLFASK
jgi:anti-anti-sigma regulatory factor